MNVFFFLNHYAPVSQANYQMQYDFLHVVISSPLIHALGGPSQTPTGI